MITFWATEQIYSGQTPTGSDFCHFSVIYFQKMWCFQNGRDDGEVANAPFVPTTCQLVCERVVVATAPKWQWFRSRSTSVLYMFWNETPAERPRCDVIPEHFHWVTARLMFHGLWVTLCYIIDQPSAVQFLFPVRLHRGSSASSVLHCPRWTLGKLCFNFIGVQISN